jgi:hypothetical protein
VCHDGEQKEKDADKRTLRTENILIFDQVNALSVLLNERITRLIKMELDREVENVVGTHVT